MTAAAASDSGDGWRSTVPRLRSWGASLAAAPSRPFPWRRPRRELLLLALVAVAALSPVYYTSDAPRVCLAEALLHGHVANDGCFAQSFDRSSYHGQLYSDKAPGLGLLDVPSVALLEPGLPASWPGGDYMRLWGIRVLSVGIAFLLCAFLVGRVVEGLAPGFGAPALVTLALGTIMAPLATTSYEHDLSAFAGFTAFLLAWRRRPALAGIAAGAAFLVDYEAALTIAIVGAYVALQGGRALARYLVGTLPGLVVLGAYDWAAFGAPWRLSYRYVDNVDAGFQGAGFFGIGTPHLFGLVDVLAGRSGLLIVSPVLVGAAYGLVLLCRDHPAEALVCMAATVVFTLANVGYFQPYGGETFGPRFLVPSLPFLALGLGPAFRARPLLTSLAAAASVIATTGLVLVWASHMTLRQTIWGELVRVPAELGSSQVAHNLTATVLSELGTSRAWGAALIVAAAAAAVAVAFGSLPWRAFATERRARRRGRSPRELVVLGACLALVAGADTCAAFAYPYGDRTLAEGLPELSTSITASGAVGGSGLSPVGAEVNFVITVTNAGRMTLDDLSLAIEVPAGLRLLGTPAVGPGAAGCNGDPNVSCYLVRLAGETQTAVRLGVVSERPGSETLSASASSDGVPARNTSTYTVHAFT